MVKTEHNDRPPRDADRRHVSFAEAFWFWVKLGFISFGGPAGQIAIMHRELVEKRRWLSDERFLHALNYCMLLPGPEAQQLAIYIGWLMHRTLGGLVAGAFFVIPSIFILLLLSYIYAAYGTMPAVAGLLSGFKPVVVAIVVDAVVRIGHKALRTRVHVALAALAFISIYLLHIPFPLIVAGAVLLGLIGSRWMASAPHAQNGGGNSSSAADFSNALLPLVIDDSEPPPEHTIPNRTRIVSILACAVALWLVPLLLIGVWRGWQSLHAAEYLFFTQAALVTFGGAYAVLAYVTQAAVESFGWIAKEQAIDGLALAETTPGPLIMVLQFVGFMAGWNNPGGLDPLAAGILGALITTYVTFLPSFVFIFIGAPYIERLRRSRLMAAALSAVTAAVVGVILNLALVFGVAVILPGGSLIDTDWFALVLTIAAFIALFKFKADVLIVVVVGGILGLAKALVL